jgi:hypothetical protein
LLTIVGNAVKFTRAGQIDVDVRTETIRDSQIDLHFTVADTGIGIPRDKLDAIFRAFEQADAGSTRHYGGTGLGLALASRLVQMLDGRIWVESVVDRGSTFHFLARFSAAPESEHSLEHAVDQASTTRGAAPDPLEGSVRQAAPQKLKILLAEDNPTNQAYAVRTLQKQGHSDCRCQQWTRSNRPVGANNVRSGINGSANARGGRLPGDGGHSAQGVDGAASHAGDRHHGARRS